MTWSAHMMRTHPALLARVGVNDMKHVTAHKCNIHAHTTKELYI